MRSGWKAAFKRPGLSLVVIVVLSVALGFSLCANIYHHADGAAIAAATKADAPADWQNAFVNVAGKLEPSVVNITSEKTVQVSSNMPDFGDFFNFGPFGGPRGKQAPETEKRTEKAGGSGVIVRSDGYILTNNHVVNGADRVTVKLTDGRTFTGKVIADPTSDLALVKIDAKDLPAAQFADSDKVKVGQWVVAIGNPFGFTNTVTAGVVSGLTRQLGVPDPEDPNGGTFYPDVIQTDASINPGNSGGPLVDLEGRVIGINCAILSRSGGNMGIGFAIPSSTVKFVMDQLIEKGKVVRGYLGIDLKDLDPVLADKLGTKEGALVGSVSKDSPAEKGGVEVKDVIVKINGKDIKNAIDLRRTVSALTPGTQVTLNVFRDKKEKTLTVKLGEKLSGDEAPAGDTGEKLGLSVQPLTADDAKQLDLDDGVKGVVVSKVEPGTAGERAGIQRGDVITEIDDSPVTSVASFSKAMKQIKSGDTAIIVVEREGHSVILELSVD